MKDPRKDISHLWQKQDDEISFIPYGDMDRDDWVDLRWNVGLIGGSSVGGICGVVKSDYFDINVLLLDKVGFTKRVSKDTTLTLGGHEVEPILAKWYEHYEEDSLVENLKAQRRVAETTEVNAIIKNEKYPYLSANIDRLVVKHRQRPDVGILEIKNTSTQYAQQFIASIPPQHIYQGYAYAMIMGLDYFEIVQNLDNFRQFFVTLFERNYKIENIIIERCEEFWERVQIGKEIFLSASNDSQAWIGLSELMYESAGQEYKMFLTDKQKEREDLVEVPGSDEVLDMLLPFLENKIKIDELKTAEAVAHNQLRKHFHDKGIRKMTWIDGPIKSVSFHKRLVITERK